MPIVPFRSTPSAQLPSRDPPDEPWALMAAAQMHSEGRLIRVMDDSGFRKSGHIEDRRDGGDDNRPIRDFGPNPSRTTSSLAADLGADRLAPK